MRNRSRAEESTLPECAQTSAASRRMLVPSPRGMRRAAAVAVVVAAAAGPAAAQQPAEEPWQVNLTIIAPPTGTDRTGGRVVQRLRVVDPAQGATGRRPQLIAAPGGESIALPTAPAAVLPPGAAPAAQPLSVGGAGPATAQASPPPPATSAPAAPPAAPPVVVGGAATSVPRREDALGQPEDPLDPDSAAMLAGPIVNEMRVAGLYHDAGFFGGRKEDGLDINAEILFRPFRFMRPIGLPRFHVGASINTSGYTSQVYGGLTWHWHDVLLRGAFINASLGLVVHDGKLAANDRADADRKELGARLMFRESLELGYRWGQRHSVSLMLDHISNANTSSNNEGLDSLGVRYGYRF